MVNLKTIGFDTDGVVRYWYKGEVPPDDYAQLRNTETSNKILGYWEYDSGRVRFYPIKKKYRELVGNDINEVKEKLAKVIERFDEELHRSDIYNRVFDEVKVIKHIKR